MADRPAADEAAVLAEQVDYYRARALEYDEWYRREGRYDRGEKARAAWEAELAEVHAALAALPLDGEDVLELAPGTGMWTGLVAARAARVTAVDAAPEMVAENRRRLGALAGRVEYVLADLFGWWPERRYDAAVVGFFLSHVPASRLERFVAAVAAALRPGGALFVVDGLRETTSTAVDHVLPEPGDEVMLRRLDDGRAFHIVKVFRSSAALAEAFAAGGVELAMQDTATYFQYGVGRRADAPPVLRPTDPPKATGRPRARPGRPEAHQA